MHGSGDGRASSLLPWATGFGERGVATVVYDKRSKGYSPVRRDFAALADDAVAAARTLRTVPGVDPARVGLAGFSEGGWVVPLAAARDPRLVGLVQLSGPDVMPNQQIAWLLDGGLRDAGAPLAARSALLRALSLRFPGDLMAFGRFDPRPSLAAADRPLLSVFGLQDGTVPVEDGAATVLTSRQDSAASTTVLLVPELGHGLTTVAGEPSADVVGLVSSWLAAPPSEPGAQVLGGAPEQRHATPVLSQSPTGTVLLLSASSTLVLAGYVLNRLARRRSVPGGARQRQPWGVAALVALAVVLGNRLGLALLAVLAVLGGGPAAAALAWGLVKLGSLAAVGVVVWALVADPPSAAGPKHRLRRAGGGVAALGCLGLAVLSGALTTVW